MQITQDNTEQTINELFKDSRNDKLKMIKAFSKSFLKSVGPADFKDVYLSISKQQGIDLRQLIKTADIKNVVEFGTSFGISTLFLAQGVLETGGHIITTELLESKAQQAKRNFEKAGVSELIEVRIGDAMKTLQGHNKPIDLLLLDGWKNLYLPLFSMLEPNFHESTVVYVDNADMGDTQTFLQEVSKNPNYHLQPEYDGKVVLITIRRN